MLLARRSMVKRVQAMKHRESVRILVQRLSTSTNGMRSKSISTRTRTCNSTGTNTNKDTNKNNCTSTSTTGSKTRLPLLPEIFSHLPATDILLPIPPPVQKCAALTRSILTTSPAPLKRPGRPGGPGQPERPGQPTRDYRDHRDSPHTPMIYTYREDLNSPLAPAGNKIRKLAYVLPHALRQPNLKTLVTVGGIQSNCCRQTAAVAAKLGLGCMVILRRDAEDVQQVQKQKQEHRHQHQHQRSLDYERTGNVQLTQLLGADVRVLDCEEEKAPVEPREEFRDLSAKLELVDDSGAFFIPQGASESPSGGVGYARWIFEMLEQEAQLRDAGTLSGSRIFDNVVVACATGGTLAGMVAGLRLAERSGWVKHGHRRKIIGIETFAQDLATRKQVVLQIARDTAELLGLQREEIRPADVNLDGRWTAGGYGVYDDQTKATIQTAARTEALLLDPVYTGKAMTAVKHGILHGELQGNTLFVHTGGHVVLPAYLGIEET